MVSLCNITLQNSLPLQKIQCEVLKVKIIFNLTTNSHPTALKPLLCNFNPCITFHVNAEKSCWWEIYAGQRKLCKSCSDVSSNIEWARLKINAKKKTVTWKFDWLLSTRVALFFSNISDGIHRSQNTENSHNMETLPRIFLFWLFYLVK